RAPGRTQRGSGLEGAVSCGARRPRGDRAARDRAPVVPAGGGGAHPRHQARRGSLRSRCRRDRAAGRRGRGPRFCLAPSPAPRSGVHRRDCRRLLPAPGSRGRVVLSGPIIDPDMRDLIERELATVERQDGVRILLAVESGSRAWGFPSPDSDYDVRFIYARPLAAYLSVRPPRDVIDRPMQGVLDVNGWDVRKALHQLVRSNAVLLEWLTSPVRYRCEGSAAERIFALACEHCHLPALAYHYDRTARRSFDQIAFSSEPARLKTYCYALRPALALRWVRDRGAPPPMDVPALLEGSILADAVRRS